jgi:hypothetical protein
MKRFDEIAFDYGLFRTQLAEFRTLLEPGSDLGERADVLPFFNSRPVLASQLGMLNPRIGHVNRIAFEFDVFGDFACDLAVGEWETGSYCFIEFEDAKPTSVFTREAKKATRKWSDRFNGGFSQIVDWCHKLHDRAMSQDFISRFGRPEINFEAVLVIGRDRHLDAGERLRLDWWTGHVLVNSKKVHCLTFDQLLSQLTSRLNLFTAVARASDGATQPSPPDGSGPVPPPT